MDASAVDWQLCTAAGRRHRRRTAATTTALVVQKVQTKHGERCAPVADGGDVLGAAGFRLFETEWEFVVVIVGIIVVVIVNFVTCIFIFWP